MPDSHRSQRRTRISHQIHHHYTVGSSGISIIFLWLHNKESMNLHEDSSPKSLKVKITALAGMATVASLASQTLSLLSILAGQSSPYQNGWSPERWKSISGRLICKAIKIGVLNLRISSITNCDPQYGQDDECGNLSIRHQLPIDLAQATRTVCLSLLRKSCKELRDVFGWSSGPELLDYFYLLQNLN